MFVLIVYLVISCHCLVQIFATRCQYGSARGCVQYYKSIKISFIAHFAFLKRIKSSVVATVMCSRIKKSCRRRRILFTAPRPPHYTEKLSSFPFIEFRHFCLARCTFCRPTAVVKRML